MKTILEIYSRIRAALLTTGKVAHVALWNHNVEFIEQETAWELPAVFVEIQPVRWDRIKEETARGRVSVVLHIVTPWTGEEQGMGAVAAADAAVVGAVDGLDGESFNALRLIETQVNHNHEDLVETLELCSCMASRRIVRGSGD